MLYSSPSVGDMNTNKYPLPHPPSPGKIVIYRKSLIFSLSMLRCIQKQKLTYFWRQATKIARMAINRRLSSGNNETMNETSGNIWIMVIQCKINYGIEPRDWLVS